MQMKIAIKEAQISADNFEATFDCTTKLNQN
jgi:hypothetical protein